MYRKYANTPFSSVTLASILTDLNAINKCNEDSLELIDFLTKLARARGWSEEIDYLSTIDTDTGMIRTDTTALVNNTSTRLGYVDTGQVLNATYQIVEVEVTLSSGSVSNAQLVVSHATKKTGITWIAINADTVPGTSYVCSLHEASGSVERIFTVVPGDMGRKYEAYWVTSAVNKEVQLDVSGGAGSEKLYVVFGRGQSA